MISSPVYGRGGDPLRQQWEGEGMRKDQNLKAARELRRTETLAEKTLWEELRNRKLNGFKFVRQAPVGPFIADFLCRERKLIIELDGWTHSTDEELSHDARRTAFFEKEGFRVVRFDNDSAIGGMDGLLVLILEELQK
jgi:very-short-patch-repair endonuclease